MKFSSVWLVLALAAAASACSATGKDQRTIAVNGHAELKIVPDQVILTLGVETFNVDLDAAKTDNDRRVSDVLAAAGKLGVADEQLKTDYLDIQPRYKETRGERTFLGYNVRKSVVVDLHDISQFEALLSAVLDAGANYVHGIDFRTSELRKHRDEARSLAIDAAREKAEAMAARLGQNVGRPISMTEGPSSVWSPYGSWWGSRRGQPMMQNVTRYGGSAGEAIDGPTVPGQLSVFARVAVTFELVD